MEKEQIQALLANTRKSFAKHCEIAKKNIANNIVHIVRTVFDGRLELDCKGEKGVSAQRISFKSVPFVPEKQKDQLFHKLVIEQPSSDGEKTVSGNPEDYTLETVCKWYLDVEKAARETLKEKEG